MYVLDYLCLTHFGLFGVAKGGEKMGILEIKILYFQSIKIKHKFRKKGGLYLYNNKMCTIFCTKKKEIKEKCEIDK